MIEFFAGLPTFAVVIIIALAVGLVFTILKKLLKFGLMLAALIILVIVIVKLLNQ